MRRTRFMSWLFLVLAAAFIAVPNFRYGLQAPLFTLYQTQLMTARTKGTVAHWLTRHFLLERYISNPDLRRESEKALQEGKPELGAFAVINLPPEKDTLRLADEVVQKDPDMTWIYAPLVLRAISPLDWQAPSDLNDAELKACLVKLENFDPHNAVPHLIEAFIIEQREARGWPSAFSRETADEQKRIAQKDWMNQMPWHFLPAGLMDTRCGNSICSATSCRPGSGTTRQCSPICGYCGPA